MSLSDYPVTRYPSGNCNFAYINNLRYYTNRPELALKSLTTYANNGLDPWSTKKKNPQFHPPSGGMWLFAQGSDDNYEKTPYARQFADYILANGLGRIVETGPVPNPAHGNRSGYLFIWIVNQAALHNWWRANVLEAFEAEEIAKSKKDQELAAMAQQINQQTDGV